MRLVVLSISLLCCRTLGASSNSSFGQCGTPDQIQSAWPQFDSAQELSTSAWNKYLQHVYPGFSPGDLAYPFCVGTYFWMIYQKDLQAAGIEAIWPATKDSMPSVGAFYPDQDHMVPGYLYEENNVYQPRDSWWIWHSKTMPSFPANTWIEVVHEADPYGDEHHGAWMNYGRGSGIWFNTGKTIVFGDHDDGYKHFASGNEAMSQAAAKQGYDSIQFTAHPDKVNYPGSKTFSYIMNTEIVAVKYAGTTACISESIMRSGWQASRPCQCDNSVGFLNCKGIDVDTSSSLPMVI